MGNPRVFNAQLSADVPPPKEITDEEAVLPVTPVGDDGDGSTIFISLVSYRDGERCAETLKSIFENAKDPDKVVIGLVEQNEPDDKYCVEEWCKSFGGKSFLKRTTVRKDMVKLQYLPEETANCPRYDQIRRVAFHDLSSKGPNFARSLARKVLGNEQYCMQIDAHTVFVENWDDVVKNEWLNARNEFAVISTAPAPKAIKHEYMSGGDKYGMVPRQCKVKFMPNGFPDFVSPADAHAADLDEPLLSHAWSAAFSFAKCHLEESVPYDPFAKYAKPIEQYSRYARMWTRGYDTYTPTQNIVFHDYGSQPNGHGDDEWFKRQRDGERKDALTRVKTIVQLFGGDPTVTASANLGIYGLGKRRNLQQLMKFQRMKDVDVGTGNAGKVLDCVGHEWVPYDATISPVENMFNKPDNLDPQPEYPMRTNFIYYQQPDKAVPKIHVSIDKEGNAEVKQAERVLPRRAGRSDVLVELDEETNLPSLSLLFVLWVFGLLVWCVMFVNSSVIAGAKKKVKKKKKQAMAKDI